MREILFRGKRVDNGEWIEGYLLNHEQKYYICNNCSDISYGDNGNRIRFGCWYEVIPETVGQYTGLTANGAKIFEGDIVRDLEKYLFHKGLFERGYKNQENYEEYRTNGNVAEVKYDTEDCGSCGCCFPLFEGAGFIAEDIKFSCCEIIGNIHDNPELVRGEEE